MYAQADCRQINMYFEQLVLFIMRYWAVKQTIYYNILVRQGKGYIYKYIYIYTHLCLYKYIL